jgi:hypothetical protein
MDILKELLMDIQTCVNEPLDTEYTDGFPEPNQETEEVLGQCPEDLLKVYILSLKYKQEAARKAADMLLTPATKELVSNIIRHARLGEILAELFWVQVNDHFNAWDRLLGLRKGGVVVRRNKL